MIQSEMLPQIMVALNVETLRSVECLNFAPGVLASVALHAAMAPRVAGVLGFRSSRS